MKKTQHRGRPIVLETGAVKKELSRKPTRLSLSFQKTSVKVGGPRRYGWRDMPNKILTPLQSHVSCFLEPPANRRAAVSATEGLWRGYSSVCPRGTICWAPVALPKPVGFLLSLLVSVPRIGPIETVSTGQISSKFPSRL